MSQLTSFLLVSVVEGGRRTLLWDLIIFLTTLVLYYFISRDIRCYNILLCNPLLWPISEIWLYFEIYSVAIDYENTDLINFLHLIEGWGPVWNWGCNKAVERWHWSRGITYSHVSFLIIDWLCLESFWKSYLHVFKKPL